MMRRFLLAVLLFASAAAFAHPPLEPAIDELLRRMTLEEKLGQLLQFTPSHDDLEAVVARGGAGSVFGVDGAAAANRLQRAALERSRLGIPLLIGHDVIHGYRTIFPIPLAIASSFDPSAAELTSRVAAAEARAAGIQWSFAPMVDVARDPRWGRIAEGAGEDPLLAAAMARAYVRGFQGTDLTSERSILACAKHFAGYGAAEGGRDYNTTDMSAARLREVYLPPFRAAVEAGVGTLMTGFNALNGVPATASAELLDGILRREWGFEGFVVSDYEAVEQLIAHGVAGNEQEAALAAIRAGVDMNMVDGTFATLAEAVRDGRLSEAIVDRAVARVLRAKFALGLFDRPYADPEREARVLLAPEHRRAAREVARKSIVLLRNEGRLLPLSSAVATVAVVGPFADSGLDMLGSWYAAGKAEEAVTPLAAIRSRAGGRLRIIHAPGADGREESSDAQMTEAIEAAGRADVVLAFLGEPGRMSGEASSRVSLDLPGRQQELLEKLVATGTPVVLILNTGRPLAISWAAEHVPAILLTWYLGSEGGHAIAEALLGEVNPGGRLPVSFPRSVGQIPVYHAHLRTGRPADPENFYTSKYLDSPNEPLYPFGFGLSYTRFAYRDLRMSAEAIPIGGTLTVSAEVRNSGERAGDEVVQLYLADVVASVARPVKELKGFRRITLQPGERRRVEFTIGSDELRFWKDGGWGIEPGKFRVWIGPSSVEGVEGSFEVGGER